MERRLAAIMAADIAGYSARMERDEEATATELAACQAAIGQQVASSGGRIFNRAGDAALAEFASPVNALVCAVEIQRQADSVASPPDRPDRLRLRIGLHLADVIVAGSDLIGDGINIAARIQQVAHPDDVWVSEPLFSQVRRQSPFTFEDLGLQHLKNISEPVRLYRVAGEMEAARWQTTPTQRRPKLPPMREGSIAVLPFTMQGAQDEQHYFTEGLTDDIIIELARFKMLSVSSRSASFVYEDGPIDPCRIGRELGVRYVLEGQVRRLPTDLRIALRLTSTETGEAVWAERFSRPPGELFDMLEAIVRRIAATVVGRVEAADVAEARRRPPHDMTAYDCLLRGLEYHRMAGVTIESRREAVRWFDQAIEIDPNYGIAYAWRICAASGLPGFNLDADLHYAERALELDQNNPEAHRIMGAIQAYQRNFDVAEYHHRRAMELNPSDAYIKARSAGFYTSNGEPERSLELIEEAQTLDPFLPTYCAVERGIALYALGHFEEAIKAFLQLPLQTPRSRLYQAASHVALGQIEEARDLTRRPSAMHRNTVSAFMIEETYRDRTIEATLRHRLREAGVPER